MTEMYKTNKKYNEAMAQIKNAIDKVIEIESQNIKPNEKIVVNIDSNHSEGIKIHAKKVLIGSR